MSILLMAADITCTTFGNQTTARSVRRFRIRWQLEMMRQSEQNMSSSRRTKCSRCGRPVSEGRRPFSCLTPLVRGVDPDSSRSIIRLGRRRRCGMSYYRLYFRDREGHFCGCRQFEADSDLQAVGRADRMCRGCSRELWCEDSLLKRWDDAGAKGFQGAPPSLLGGAIRIECGAFG